MKNEKRLIDANALMYKVSNSTASKAVKAVCSVFISSTPTVDAVEVVHGQWKPRPYHKFNSEGRLIKYCDFYYCSECGTERPVVPPYTYCPNCGAKMDGDSDG